MTEEIKNEEAKGKEAVTEGTAEASNQGLAAKFKKNRALTTVGVIVVVIIVAGIGFFAWHNTPGFCGTMCHESMSYYTNTYETDSATLAYRHGHTTGKATATLKEGVADSSKACLDCHPASIGEQIKELGMTIDGDYTVTTEGKLLIEDGHFKATKEFCTQCHDYEKVVAATANYNGGSHDSESGAFNPHASHQGDLACSTCHNVHGTSTLYCTSCHEADVPEGWQTVAQSMEAA